MRELCLDLPKISMHTYEMLGSSNIVRHTLPLRTMLDMWVDFSKSCKQWGCD